MEDYNTQNKKFIKNGLIISDRLLTEATRLKRDRITDTALIRYLDHFTSEIEKIKTTIVVNPRFDWINIQEKIDRLYSIDKNMTGMRIWLDWKDGENRGFFKHPINRKL